jgi:hypothetical protein
MTASVSGIRGGSQGPAADGREGLLSWAHPGPGVTAVVRCGPVVRGPNVAPGWPRPSRALEGASRQRHSRDAMPRTQLSASPRPLLSVGDRQAPLPGACGGHGRRGPPWLGRGGDGHQLNQRVRPVLGDALPRGQEPEGSRQPGRVELWANSRSGAALSPVPPRPWSLRSSWRYPLRTGVDAVHDSLRSRNGWALPPTRRGAGR